MRISWLATCEVDAVSNELALKRDSGEYGAKRCKMATIIFDRNPNLKGKQSTCDLGRNQENGVPGRTAKHWKSHDIDDAN
ncbi:hypothetical protein PABG_04250 [Paracoccidioides brasiliensis Pb03]|nr:hypothetical protein PABG_04250 [Paracoccidioides brasiliensis Pb03]